MLVHGKQDVSVAPNWAWQLDKTWFYYKPLQKPSNGLDRHCAPLESMTPGRFWWRNAWSAETVFLRASTEDLTVITSAMEEVQTDCAVTDILAQADRT